MNVPNAITLSRLVVTAATFVCLELVADPARPDPTLIWLSFALFLGAALTDFLDGYLARKWNMVTAFGRVADPFADKVLIAGSLVLLLKFPAARSVMPFWYVVVVIAREFLVTAIRGVVEASGRPFPADRLGKWKMVTQCWTAASLMMLIAGVDSWHTLTVTGLWLSFALTVVSGVNYAFKARGVLFAR